MKWSWNPFKSFIGATANAGSRSVAGVDVPGNSVQSQLSGAHAGAVNSMNNILGSYLNKLTGAGLTGAEHEANAFSEYMANTQYQRGVKDMQEAGLNPALMYGSSSSGAGAPQSVSPSSASFQDIVQLAMLPAQLKQMSVNMELSRSQADLNRANADNVTQQARNNKLNADFLQDTYDLRKGQMEESKNLTHVQIREIYKRMDKMDKEMDLLVNQAATEEERKVLTTMQAKLAQANAHQIDALLPYEIAFKKAATKAQKAAATASFVHAAYEQGLIDSGYIDYLAQEVKSRADVAEQQALALEFVNALKTGNITEFLNKCTGGSVPIPDGIISAFMIVSSMLGNVFGGLLK